MEWQSLETSDDHLKHLHCVRTPKKKGNGEKIVAPLNINYITVFVEQWALSDLLIT